MADPAIVQDEPQQPQSSGISPYLVMQAQQEAASGKPGAATAQLGAMALKSGAMHPAVAAMHAEKAGVLPPGSASKFVGPPAPQQAGTASPQPNPVPQTAANPAGVAGSSPGQPTEGALAEISAIKDAASRLGMPTSVAQAQDIPKGTSESVKDDDSNKAQVQSTIKLPYSPESQKLNLDTNRGISHPITGYENLTDARGMPVMGPDGQPMQDKNKPIYDMTKSTVDPTAPYQQQSAALQKLQALLDQKRAQGQPVRPADLSGLMMAADFLNHTNTFGSDYAKQQENAEQGRNDADKNTQQNYEDQNQIQKDTNDLNKDLITQSNATLNGGTQAQLLQRQEQLALSQGYNNQPKAGQSTAANQFMTQVQKLFKDVQGDETEADKVTQLVNSHNPAAISGIKEALTRLMTGARPQMALIATQAQDPSLGQRMETYLNLAENGQLPVENVAQMNQMVADIDKVSNGRRAVATRQAQTFGSNIGLDQQAIEGMIPARASASLPAQAASQGRQSIKVQQGKAAASQNGMVTMYKGGQAYQVPRANVVKAQGRGYSMDKQ